MLDLRLVNANIITMDPARPAAREIGLWQGRIVGLDEAVSSLPADRVIDLQNATVLPGFLDAHVHLAWAGLEEGGPTIAGHQRVADALAAIGTAVAARPPGEWVDVHGYDQRRIGRHLTAAELDSVSAGRKVFMVHQSGHARASSTARCSTGSRPASRTRTGCWPRPAWRPCARCAGPTRWPSWPPRSSGPAGPACPKG